MAMQALAQELNDLISRGLTARDAPVVSAPAHIIQFNPASQQWEIVDQVGSAGGTIHLFDTQLIVFRQIGDVNAVLPALLPPAAGSQVMGAADDESASFRETATRARNIQRWVQDSLDSLENLRRGPLALRPGTDLTDSLQWLEDSLQAALEHAKEAEFMAEQQVRFMGG